MMFVEAFPAFPIPILSICFDFRQQNASIHSDKSLTKEEAINSNASRSEKLILTRFWDGTADKNCLSSIVDKREVKREMRMERSSVGFGRKTDTFENIYTRRLNYVSAVGGEWKRCCGLIKFGRFDFFRLIGSKRLMTLKVAFWIGVKIILSFHMAFVLGKNI